MKKEPLFGMCDYGMSEIHFDCWCEGNRKGGFLINRELFFKINNTKPRDCCWKEFLDKNEYPYKGGCSDKLDGDLLLIRDLLKEWDIKDKDIT
jgi:hypothetical protein